MPIIEITVAKNGDVNLEVKGVSGTSCTQLTEAMEQALGTVESRECKTEFFQEQTTDENLKLGA